MRTNTAGSPTSSARQRRVAVLGVGASVFVFAILAAFQAYVVPVYNPPDEASHVGYMIEVSHGRLPTIDTEIPPDAFPRKLYDVRDDAHQDIWVANHPPLFYWATALPARLGSRTMPYLAGIRLVRLLPIAFGALSVLLIAALAARLVPGRPQVMVAAAALTAASPAFSHFSGILYNDSLGVLTSTATLLAAVDLLRGGPSRGRLALLAGAAALAALSRSSGLIVMGIAGLAAIASALIHRGEGAIRSRLLRGVGMAALVGIAVAATSGWFYLRNVRLYGDPTGAAALFSKFDRVPNGSPLALLASPRIWGLEAQRLVDYSYFNLSDVRRLEDSETVWSRLLLLVPVLGMLVILLRRARYRLIPSLRSPRLVAWGLCLLFLVLLGWSVVSFAAGGGNVHGRYLFPGLGVLATGAALGLGALPFGRRGVLVVAVVVAMHVLGYMVAQQYLEAAAIQVPGQTPLETVLVAIGGPPAWLLLGPLALVLGALTAIQAVALWRLAPPATGYVLLPSRRPRAAEPSLEPAGAAPDGRPAPAAATGADPETASISATTGG
jgi:hypothetical protein